MEIIHLKNFRQFSISLHAKHPPWTWVQNLLSHNDYFVLLSYRGSNFSISEVEVEFQL